MEPFSVVRDSLVVVGVGEVEKKRVLRLRSAGAGAKTVALLSW